MSEYGAQGDFELTPGAKRFVEAMEASGRNRDDMPVITYTAIAPAEGRGQSPDEAIEDLIVEVGQPSWSNWHIFGEVVLYHENDGTWIAKATVTRTFDFDLVI